MSLNLRSIFKPKANNMAAINPFHKTSKTTPVCLSGMKELRARMDSVKNTKKITDAMKLVSAAKVRKAQDKALSSRPFNENLVKVLKEVNQTLRDEDVASPLTIIRPVKSVMVVAVTGDRGLCGGYNNNVIKKTLSRIRDLNLQGVDTKVVTIGRKGSSFFERRSQKYKISKSVPMGNEPSSSLAQSVAELVATEFISQEVDKVEIVYTKFLSILNSQPTIRTLIPIARSGELCDINGKCIDFAEDEFFRLTSSEGKLSLSRDSVKIPTPVSDGSLELEQSPKEILDFVLPLYLNVTINRAVLESNASFYAACMNAMNSASDNAAALGKRLEQVYNRRRQAAITSQLIEIVSGADAV